MIDAPAKNTAQTVFSVALAGNPNVGKTTLFNALTGLRHRVGNYPGTTVERKFGLLTLGQKRIRLLDLPGCYSLAASAPDEEIAAGALTGFATVDDRPAVVICVVDATNIRRNLILAHQIMDLGYPIVVALNLMDEAETLGVQVNAEDLSLRLGVPVVPTVARSGKGVDALLATIGELLDRQVPAPAVEWPAAIQEAAELVQVEVVAKGHPAITPGQARRFLFNTDPNRHRWLGLSREAAETLLERARLHIRHSGVNPLPAEAMTLYRRIDTALAGLDLRLKRDGIRGTESIDRILTHRVWGLVIFAAIMILLFQLLYTGAVPLMDGVDWIFGTAGGVMNQWLAPWPLVRSFIVDGALSGMGSVLVFLPQIALLFLFLGILEDSGYLARAAFLMDRSLRWSGLSGKSFVPMLSCYACAVPGIMATRTISDPTTRLLTIIVSPLMSCSARLPVYVLLIGAFIEPRFGAAWAGAALFGAHVIGILVALPLSLTLKRLLPPASESAFLLEMPPYRVPVLRGILWRVWVKARDFIFQAGSIILAISLIVWALLAFPRPEEVRENVTQAFVTQTAAASNESPEKIQQALAGGDADLKSELEHKLNAAFLEQSWLGRFGKFVQPVFAPAGFDWKITVGILSSFPAREVIVSTLGVIYGLGNDMDESSKSLRSNMAVQLWTSGPRAGAPVFSLATVCSLLVFFALCMQCGATVAVIARETNRAWAIGTFCLLTGIAWLCAVATYQTLFWVERLMA